MSPSQNEITPTGFLDRFRKSWFPPAAVVGAFAAFVAAAFRVRPTPIPAPRSADSPGTPGPPYQSPGTGSVARVFDWEYTRTAVLGGTESTHPFLRTLRGIAVGADDRILALGDDEIRIFDSGGIFVEYWRAPEKAGCLTVSPDGRIFVGAADRVEIHDGSGNRAGGFAVGEIGKPGDVTAIKVFRKEILVADAAARFIRRYDSDGRQLGVIGTKSKTGGFILPNRSLDIAVNSRGVVYATDTGRHQVTAWTLDGSPLDSFGKFGMSDPKDFVGCCNPVNLALLPDGKIVTAEKMVARVKVYAPEGRLLAVIGPEHFDPQCTHIHVVADPKGRILAADPVRREIGVFSRLVKAGTNGPSDTLCPAVDGKPQEPEPA